MAWPSQQWRQVSFTAALLEPRLRVWSSVTDPDRPESVHARALVSDLLLWQSLGLQVGYFDEKGAGAVSEAIRSTVFDGIYDWLGPRKAVLAPAAIDWLLRIREEGLRRPEDSRYARASGDAPAAFQVHFQAGLLLAGRSTAVGDGLASAWTAQVMYADDEQWDSVVRGLEQASPANDRDRALGDDATSVLEYMSTALDLLNAAAQDERFNDLERQQFSADFGLLIGWPLNLEAESVRRRFDAFFAACIAATAREHRLSERQALRMREDVARLADAWRETIGAAAAVADFA